MIGHSSSMTKRCDVMHYVFILRLIAVYYCFVDFGRISPSSICAASKIMSVPIVSMNLFKFRTVQFLPISLSLSFALDSSSSTSKANTFSSYYSKRVWRCNEVNSWLLFFHSLKMIYGKPASYVCCVCTFNVLSAYWMQKEKKNEKKTIEAWKRHETLHFAWSPRFLRRE